MPGTGLSWRGGAEGTQEGDLNPGLCFATRQPCARRKGLGASEPQFPRCPASCSEHQIHCSLTLLRRLRCSTMVEMMRLLAICFGFSNLAVPSDDGREHQTVVRGADIKTNFPGVMIFTWTPYASTLPCISYTHIFKQTLL